MNYQQRKIAFLELHSIDDWTFKIYSICKEESAFDSSIFENVKGQISNWIELNFNVELPTQKIGFVIIHQAREGVFVILNWWVDQVMLQSHVYFSDFQEPYLFKPYKYSNVIACIWELEIMNYEKNAWVESVLKQVGENSISCYLNQKMTASF
jgi:hypothetical protein